MYADIAVERGNWALAARLYAEGVSDRGPQHGRARCPGCAATAIALAQLGADEDALELEASANSITAAIGEVSSDPLTDKHGWALDEARERVGPDRAAAPPAADASSRVRERRQSGRDGTECLRPVPRAVKSRVARRVKHRRFSAQQPPSVALIHGRKPCSRAVASRQTEHSPVGAP